MRTFFIIFSLIFSLSLFAQDAEAPTTSQGDVAYKRATIIYDYGREAKEYYEKRNALKTAENSYRNFFKSFPNHPKVKTAQYRMAVCQLLTGNEISAEANLIQFIERYKSGQLVAAAAFRMAVQRYNQKEYEEAQTFFRKCAYNTDKPDLKYQALYRQARCLMLTGDKKRAFKPLQELVDSPENTFKESAQLALAHLSYEVGEYEKALVSFNRLNEREGILGEQKEQIKLYIGLSLAKLSRTEEAFPLLLESLDNDRLSEELKSQAQAEVLSLLFKQEKYSEIIEIYNSGIIVGEPVDNAKSYKVVGYTFLKQESYSQAKEAFLLIEKLVPNTALSFEANFRRIYCAYQQNEYYVPDLVEAFSEIYASYKREHPWHQLAKLYRAEKLFEREEYDLAAKSYRAIIDTGLPESVQENYLFKKACCLAIVNDHNAAIEHFSRYLTDFPKNALAVEVMLRRGLEYLEVENFSAAGEDFKQVIESAPGSVFAAPALQNLGVILKKEKRYADLSELYKLLLEKYPSLKREAVAHAQYWIGWAEFKQEKWDAAVPHFSLAREKAPEIYNEPAGTRIMLASYYSKNVDLMDQSVGRLQKDVEGKFIPPRMLAWLGIQQFQKGEYGKAIQNLESLTTGDKESVPLEVWRHLAKSYLKSKDYRKSLELFTIVLEKEKDDFWKADTYLDLTHTYIGLGQMLPAIDSAKQGLALEPKGTIEAGLRFSLGETYFVEDDFLSAANQYQIVADRFEKDPKMRPYSLWKAELSYRKADLIEKANLLSNIRKKEFPDWNSEIEGRN